MYVSIYGDFFFSMSKITKVPLSHSFQKTNNNKEMEQCFGSETMRLHWGALSPPPSHPSVEDLLVRGWGGFSLQGHIPLYCLPNVSSPSSILLLLCTLSLFPSCLPLPKSSTPHVQHFTSVSSLFSAYVMYSYFLLNNGRSSLSHSYLFAPLFPSAPFPHPMIQLLCSRA